MRQSSALLAFTLFSLGCAGASVARQAPAGAVRTGLEVLARDSMAPLHGLRVGLITNHTGIAVIGGRTVSGIDLLHNSPHVELVKLFGPEHGFSGRAAAGEKVGDVRDDRTGLPVLSLYGQTQKPTPAMLEGLDALLFDIQDIGTRYYTYVWTMALALQAAAENDIRFVVLDRPNPIGGELAQGNVLDPKFATFVGLYPVPMRHGLTAGELARFLNAEFGFNAKLTVIPMEGWSRSQWFDRTGLPWVAPSPAMPSLESATHYPGTCLFEGTNLSAGRGTEHAFAQIGAPWLRSDVIIERLRARNLPGVRFEAVRFTPANPSDNKFPGVEVNGIRYIVTDRGSYDPTITALATIREIMNVHADVLEFRVSHFDRLAGTDRVRLALLAGQDVASITADWQAQLAAFSARAAKYRLYR